MEDLVSILLNDGNEEHMVKIGSNLGKEVRMQLINFLRKNVDIFAWIPMDMPGIDAEVMQHHLAADPKHRPTKEKVRSHAPERQLAIAEKVDKLLKVGFIREVNYSSWVSNVVLVKKANGKWRMYIDFKKLNKACPKDSYPLPRID